MIEYITQTGAFGVLWVLLTLIFPFITYKFIQRNKIKAIQPILTVSIMLLMFNITGIRLMGKTNYDTSLILIKDSWFLVYHVFLITVYIMVDPKLMENLFKKTEAQQ